jgi:hypothetical protein
MGELSELVSGCSTRRAQAPFGGFQAASQQSTIIAIQPQALVCDEVQYLKTYNSARTEAVKGCWKIQNQRSGC